MKKVLLTGSTGFIGAYLLHYLLKEGYEVIAMKRESSPMHLVESVADQVRWVTGDIMDLPFLEEIMQDVEEVYHAAAIVSFDAKQSQKMIQVNSEGTANVVNAALAAKVSKFLHVSSIAALGRLENKQEVDENAQWENSKLNSSYAISKFKAECEVWRGIQEGLNAVIINPSMVMGAGFWHNGTPKMFWRVAKGLRFYPKGTTGFVDVRDVAKIAIALMQSDINNERFIISAENWSYKKLFSQMAKGLGKSSPKVQLPSWGVHLMWRLDAVRARVLGLSPTLTRDIATNMQLKMHYHNEKIVKALNYNFIPMEQCIKDTAATFRQSKKENSPAALLDII